jgi:prepilin-type N-terminal cleavage/methylation domain-containing protein
MNRRDTGFTLVEMLIVIGIIGFVLAGTSQMFISMLRTHRQQSRITESNIEGIIGLELLRQDLEKAGYGLPWNDQSGSFNYLEKTTNTPALNDAPSNPPRGIVGKDNVTGVTGVLDHTDYLAIKAADVAINSACSKWTFLPESGGPPTTWYLNNGAPAASENLSGPEGVIVISPGTPDSPTARTLVRAGGQWRAQFNAVSDFASPVSGPETRVIYGINSDVNLRMPFNRADYFVMQPSSTQMPQRCAQGTGVLYKAVLNHSNGEFSYMPLLDCVADMQVIFRATSASDSGNLTTIAYYQDISDPSIFDAPGIRNRIKEVRVYILAHEGQRDPGYQHPNSKEYVGEKSLLLGRDFDFSSAGITDWQNYRWKVYTLVAKLNNLR